MKLAVDFSYGTDSTEKDKERAARYARNCVEQIQPFSSILQFHLSCEESKVFVEENHKKDQATAFCWGIMLGMDIGKDLSEL